MQTSQDALGANVEREHLDIGYIPIVCSAPLLFAQSHGIFTKNGLHVTLHPAPGWSAIKELLVYGQLDVAHMLTPMPLACHLGADGKRAGIKIAAIQNINGQALTLAAKHRGLVDGRALRGLTFGVPYFFSMQYYLLCGFLARHGIDPQKDVIIKEVAPPVMPRYIEKGLVDGLLAPEPYNQLVVNRELGFIHTLSKTLWEGHPCCCVGVGDAFPERYPNTYRAVLASIIEAQIILRTATADQKRRFAYELCATSHFVEDAPMAIGQVLTGQFHDGRGGHHTVPDRIDFVPYLWDRLGTWLIEQMQRWGQIEPVSEPSEIVRAVFDQATCRDVAEKLDFGAYSLPQVPDSPPLEGPSKVGHVRRDRYEMEAALRDRLSILLEQLAAVAGGRLELRVEITSNDEIGQIERMLNEIVLNARFIQDQLAQSTEHQLRLRQEVITAQEATLRKLSTPIVPVIEGVLVIPVIGTINAKRAQQIMDTLLAAIAQYQTTVFIVDITGVSEMNAEIADHLLRIVRAAALLGAQGILTGISSAVAQTIVTLGVELTGLTTCNTLQSGIQHALSIMGKRIAPVRPSRSAC